MPDNSITLVSELPDTIVEGCVQCQAVAANMVLFVADRDYWVQQLWTRGPTETDAETYQFWKIRPGEVITASSAAAAHAITDAVEAHASNTAWVANTRYDFTILTDKSTDAAHLNVEAHHLQAGDMLIIRASTQLALLATAGFRLTSRRQ